MRISKFCEVSVTILCANTRGQPAEARRILQIRTPNIVFSEKLNFTARRAVINIEVQYHSTMLGKTFPILLAVAVASAPILCCCILSDGHNGSTEPKSGPLAAAHTDTDSCCPTRSDQDPLDDSSCSCTMSLVLASESPVPAVIISDPVELSTLSLVIVPRLLSLTDLSLDVPLVRVKPLSSFHGDSLHALSCLFT